MANVTMPSMFIGSSSEGLGFARAVRSLLDNDVEVTLWNEGFFRLGDNFIETLINEVARFDFAVLVLTPDDLISSRDVATFGPRDNVIFELGLFMGRLGRSRTFVLHQDDPNLKIPSDLAGIKTAVYRWPREDGSEKGAVGAACDAIRDLVRDLGISEAKTAQAISNITLRQESQEQKLSKQQSQIRSIQVALEGILTQYEFDTLIALSKDEPFLCYYSDELYKALERLVSVNFVRHLNRNLMINIRLTYHKKPPGFGSISNREKFDLRQCYEISDHGREYLALRSELAYGETDGYG